jgi:hypothetical protein
VNTDLKQSFDKLIDSTFTRVNGVVVEKTKTGYRYGVKDLRTIDEVKAAMQQSYKNLNNSIKSKLCTL